EGRNAGAKGREGRWRWWSERGELVDEREFVGGVASGAAAQHRVPEGAFSDARIASWQGHFVQGERAGRWLFKDNGDALLHERNFGTPCFSIERDHPLLDGAIHDWLDRAERWRAKGQVGLL